MHCARCHVVPDINHLPIEYWIKSILPEMAARMGIKDGDFKPYDKMGFDEMQIVHKSGIYPYLSILNDQDWNILKEYILNIAPDSLQPKVQKGILKKQNRFTAKDFDQDGDIDFGIISTFPDYTNKPEYSIVYLENLDAKSYKFQTYSFEEANLSRWFLLDSGDIDKDGDTDIILSAFTYVFTPVPSEITSAWDKNNVDFMILENTLIDKKKVE